MALAALVATGSAAAAAVSGSEAHPNASTATSQLGSAEDQQLAELKAEVAKLTSQISALQGQVATLQGNLQAFHTQFSQHVHTFPPSPTGIMTILNCSGYGQPCTSATSLKEITVLTPENSPGLGVTSAPTTPPIH
jgi:uncharacterized coiled-coil protein SlyX